MAQIFLAYWFQGVGENDKVEGEKKHFGNVLLAMSAFMLAGAVTTHWLVPETRDHDNKSRTLEVLAGGRVVIDKLNKQRESEDD